MRHLFMVPHHKEELLSCLAYGPCDIFKKQQLTHVIIAMRIHASLQRITNVGRRVQTVQNTYSTWSASRTRAMSLTS